MSPTKKVTVATLPSVPGTTPIPMIAQVSIAHAEAINRLSEYEELEQQVAAKKKAADAAVKTYEDLLLEASGQGTLPFE